MRIKKTDIFSLLIAISCVATAQSENVTFIDPGNQDAINQRQRTILEHENRQRETLKSNLSINTEQLSLQDDSQQPCFQINNIVLQDAKHLPLNNQQNIINHYKHQCLTVTKIKQLVKDISNAYISAGFITSFAYLQPQNVAQGELTINVLEGKIEAITYDGETPFMLKTLFPDAIDNILNLRQLEQGLENLSRLPAYKGKIDIAPGTKPGYSIVNISRESQHLPISLYLQTDNSGQKSTGETQSLINIKLDNPLRLADQWSISLSRNSVIDSRRSSRYANLKVSIPYGYWSGSYYYGWNDFSHQMPLSKLTLDYKGKSEVHRFGLNRVLFRDGVSKSAVDLSVTRRKSSTYLGDYLLLVNSPTLSYLNAELSFSRRFDASYLTFSPAITHGLHLAKATADDPERPNEPRSGFRRFSLSSSYYYQFAQRWNFLTSIYGQYSPDNLYGSERIAIGGEYSVRGFKDFNLAGNKGYYWRNEINWYPNINLPLGYISIAPALDWGKIKKQSPTINGGSLIGSSLSVGWYSNYASTSITFGKPLHYSDNTKPDNWVAYWRFSLSL